MRYEMNWFGFGCALAALVCLLFLPFYSAFIIPIGMMLMLKLGQYLLIIPLFGCLAMGLASLLLPKNVRLIIGGVTLVIILAMMFSGGAMTQSIYAPLAAAVGVDASVSNTASSVLSFILGPGLGTILAALLCLVYIILEAVMGTNLRRDKVITEDEFFA